MGLEIVTKEDLQVFRLQLLKDIQDIINKAKEPADNRPEGYKTSHVRKILGCSINKLVLLQRLTIFQRSNMGFSAMLADEYSLSVQFTFHLQFRDWAKRPGRQNINGHEWFPENSMSSLEKLAATIPVPSYAIDDQTAIKVTDSTIEVVSEGNRKLFSR